MYHLTPNYQLRQSNTFGISAIAKHYLTVDSSEDITQFFKDYHREDFNRLLLLGGGSNLLFTGDYDGLIIHPVITGIRVITENNQTVEVEAGAGVVWDHFVAWCVSKGWSGIENLSLIPGHTGAVPVQNIGAYGVEAASVISEVRGIDLESGQFKSLSCEMCHFGYRSSIFKEQLKGKFVVTSVLFKLSKEHQYRLNYQGLESRVQKYGETNLTNIRKAIIAIRESKLPDPSKTGNGGSFFKNPVVSDQIAGSLKEKYPNIPIYRTGGDNFKVAAGWLIEQAGWKGKMVGKAAVHDQQALVIINLGGASGKEIVRLSKLVAEDVLQKFNIVLDREVEVVGDET